MLAGHEGAHRYRVQWPRTADVRAAGGSGFAVGAWGAGEENGSGSMHSAVHCCCSCMLLLQPGTYLAGQVREKSLADVN
jgi:hypothetical protein